MLYGTYRLYQAERAKSPREIQRAVYRHRGGGCVGTPARSSKGTGGCGAV
jgi:hypothetical protein